MLRMGAGDYSDQFRQTVSGRWQIPLVGVSLVTLGLALVGLRPVPPPPSFQQLLDQISALQRGEFFVEASEMAQQLLLAEDLSKEQRGELHRSMAETIYLAERRQPRHDPENAKRVISNHRQALAFGLSGTPSVHSQVGEALCWIDLPQKAVEQFRKSIDAGSDEPGRLCRHIIQLLQESGEAKPAVIQKELSVMLADDKLDRDDLLWAVALSVDLYSRQGKLDAIEDLLADVKPRFDGAGLGTQLRYLQARRSYLDADFDQAERLLLSLRGKVKSHELLGAKVGWLLGRVHLADARPQEALVFFQEVMRNQPSGEYYLAARLGIAECLAALYHMEEAADAYEEVAGLAARYADGEVVDRDAVRVSLTTLYSILRREGRLEPAVRFLRLAAALVPVDDDATQVRYLRMLGDIYVSIGEDRLAQARPTTRAVGPTGGEDSSERTAALEMAHEAFREAAEIYLRLSRLLVMDPPRSAEVTWLAALQFDRANMPDRMMSVLEDFMHLHQKSTKLPELLYRLGQANQSLGRLEKAIGRYAENIRRFPRTPHAMQSLVPMARCLIALGKDKYPAAERVLLSVVDQPTEKGRYNPEALEFREALFVLGTLYDRQSKCAKAITRLEEFLERYPNDTRVTHVEFVLASSYRKSGLAMMSSDGKTDGTGVSRGGGATQRLARAEGLFTKVVDAFGKRPFTSLSPIEQFYLKHSYVYRADCAFDMKQYDRALSMYEEASRRFRRDPISLSAYVQILNCYQRSGRGEDARATLRRLKWLIKSIPPERFAESPGQQGLAYWQGFFDWVDKSGLY